MQLLAGRGHTWLIALGKSAYCNAKACFLSPGGGAPGRRVVADWTAARSISTRLFAAESRGAVRAAWPRLLVRAKNTSSAAETAIKGKDVKRTVKRSELSQLFAMAAPEKWRLTGAMVLLLISSGVSMAVPYVVGKSIDIMYNSSHSAEILQKLTAFCQVLAIVFLLSAVAAFGRIYLIQTSGQRIVKRLREQLFTSIMSQEMAFFDKNKTGELVNRLSNDTSMVSYAVTQNVADGLRSFLYAVGGVSMMFYTSTKLAVVGLAIVPVVYAIFVPFGRYIRQVSKEITDSLASATQVAEERLSSVRTVRAFGQELNEVALYQKHVDSVLQLSYRESLLRAANSGVATLIGNALVVAVLYTGGMLVAQQQISIGELSSFLLYVAFVGSSLSSLGDCYAELMHGVGASTRMWELLLKTPTIPLSIAGAAALPLQSDLVGRIQFANVTFAYPTRPHAAIFKDMTLDVTPGQVTAVVGASGSGKSTLASLILRFYDVDKGSVMVDNMDVTATCPTWLRKHVGIVSQEPVLFSSSIRDNILYGAADPKKVTKEEIEHAAQQANCMSFISSFPDGIDTLVGERGASLSGGQKQRVAIARAILKNPRILILDEATSALDSESEYLVQDALEQLMVGRTVLVIAHRLSTIRNADNVVVLAGGGVAEKGSYNDLMNLPNGKFRAMVERQTFDREDE